MRLIAAIMLVSMLSGCATFAKPEIITGCQVADTVTTIAALKAGASEANPIVAGVIKHAGYFGLIALKVAVTMVLIHYATEQPEATGAVTAATCAAAVNNVLLL